jgi:hypothetical protein
MRECLDSALNGAILSGMIQWQKLFFRTAPRPAVVAASLGLAFLTASPLPADARGMHGLGRSFGGHGMHGPQFSGDRRHGNDAYIKASSDERDKLLTTKLKSICHGC